MSLLLFFEYKLFCMFKYHFNEELHDRSVKCKISKLYRFYLMLPLPLMLMLQKIQTHIYMRISVANLQGIEKFI